MRLGFKNSSNKLPGGRNSTVEELSTTMNPQSPDARSQEIEEAYAEHGTSVFRFAMRLCGNRDDAEDVVVETFAHAYHRWDSFNGTGTRKTWLFGIAANRARMAHRRKRVTEPLDENLPHPGQNPMELIALEKELARLSPRQREAFLLVKGEGLTAREAAETLGRPVGTILYEVHRAVHRLRRALGEGPISTPLLEAEP